MILTTDVYYSDDTAVAVGILHPAWRSDAFERTIVKRIEPVAPYEPGAFYKRELPCLMRLLDDVDEVLEAIIVDGYVSLGAARSPGLGWHLHERIGGSSPVIGVAKSEFAGTPEECRVFRGRGRQPLYVTAVGVPLDLAKARIVRMHGPYRIPTLLKLADRLGRDHAGPPSGEPKSGP